MKKDINEINLKLEEEASVRQENEQDILNSFNEINLKVKSQIVDEKLKREQFADNIFKLLEETTKQLSLIN
jgi:hypothetical protein